MLRQLALAAHVRLELLDDIGRYDPQALVQVELVGSRLAQFPGPHAGKHQQPKAQLRLQPAAVFAHALQVFR